jgi:hypothetical protein
MSTRPSSLLALALSLTASVAVAQSVTAPVAPEGASGMSGAVGGAATNNGGSAAPTAGVTPTMAVSPGFGGANSAPSAPGSAANGAANLPARAEAGPAGAAPASAAPLRFGGRAPARDVPAPAVSNRSDDGAPALSGEHASTRPRAAAAAPALTAGAHAAAALAGSHDAAAASANAGAALNGAARKLSEARLAESAGGDNLSVSRALDLTFDAALAGSGAAALHSGVAGRAQDIRGSIAQKVTIANSASPADAPSLYQDAIQTAKDALPAPTAVGVAKVVRRFAARKADVSLGDLAAAAYQAAAGGSASETGRLLSAFDKWESLLGAPGRPLISNGAALKTGVEGLLKSAAAGGAHSAPHVWFAKKDGAYTAVLPGPGVAPVPALAAAFALAPSALAPETALSDAYRAFSSDPRSSTGAGLVYRARRALGASVPAAAASASRFWLRAALESFWRRVVAFFKGAATYQLSQKAGQDALRRDAALAATARGEAASTRRLISNARLSVSGARAAFAALARSAEAYRALTGDGAGSAEVESLRRGFESAAAERGLRAGDMLSPGLDELVSGPLAFWSERLEAAASGVVDARFRSARGAAEFVNLGSERGPGAVAAAELKAAVGAPLAIVTLDERYWARGQGSNGEARLSVGMKATAAGGGVELHVQRGDAALARRLEDFGLTVFPEGAGLRAGAGPEDFSYDAAELGLLASRALTAALGREEASSAGSDLRSLADATRRDPASAARLAALFDGREAFARAPVIGLVGDYEALAPMAVSVDGKPLLVSALRDPDTGLLAYARAARPGGAPLGAAEMRALLRAK